MNKVLNTVDNSIRTKIAVRCFNNTSNMPFYNECKNNIWNKIEAIVYDSVRMEI